MRSDSVSDRKQKRYDRMISSTPATVQAYRQAGLPSGGWSYKDVGGPLLVCNASGRWSARLTRTVEPVGDSVLAGSLVHWGIYQTVGRSVGLGTVAETRRDTPAAAAPVGQPGWASSTDAYICKSRGISATSSLHHDARTDGRTDDHIYRYCFLSTTDRPTDSTVLQSARRPTRLDSNYRPQMTTHCPSLTAACSSVRLHCPHCTEMTPT